MAFQAAARGIPSVDCLSSLPHILTSVQYHFCRFIGSPVWAEGEGSRYTERSFLIGQLSWPGEGGGVGCRTDCYNWVVALVIL
jgi:hypothetical protein